MGCGHISSSPNQGRNPDSNGLCSTIIATEANLSAPIDLSFAHADPLQRLSTYVTERITTEYIIPALLASPVKDLLRAPQIANLSQHLLTDEQLKLLLSDAPKEPPSLPSPLSSPAASPIKPRISGKLALYAGGAVLATGAAVLGYNYLNEHRSSSIVQPYRGPVPNEDQSVDTLTDQFFLTADPGELIDYMENEADRLDIDNFQIWINMYRDDLGDMVFHFEAALAKAYERLTHQQKQNPIHASPKRTHSQGDSPIPETTTASGAKTTDDEQNSPVHLTETQRKRLQWLRDANERLGDAMYLTFPDPDRDVAGGGLRAFSVQFRTMGFTLQLLEEMISQGRLHEVLHQDFTPEMIASSKLASRAMADPDGVGKTVKRLGLTEDQIREVPREVVNNVLLNPFHPIHPAAGNLEAGHSLITLVTKEYVTIDMDRDGLVNAVMTGFIHSGGKAYALEEDVIQSSTPQQFALIPENNPLAQTLDLPRDLLAIIPPRFALLFTDPHSLFSRLVDAVANGARVEINHPEYGATFDPVNLELLTNAVISGDLNTDEVPIPLDQLDAAHIFIRYFSATHSSESGFEFQELHSDLRDNSIQIPTGDDYSDDSYLLGYKPGEGSIGNFPNLGYSKVEAASKAHPDLPNALSTFGLNSPFLMSKFTPALEEEFLDLSHRRHILARIINTYGMAKRIDERTDGLKVVEITKQGLLASRPNSTAARIDTTTNSSSLKIIAPNQVIPADLEQSPLVKELQIAKAHLLFLDPVAIQLLRTRNSRLEQMIKSLTLLSSIRISEGEHAVFLHTRHELIKALITGYFQVPNGTKLSLEKINDYNIQLEIKRFR